MHRAQVALGAAAFVGYAAASPAPQNLDLAAIINAPPATISGPSLAAISQISVINTQSIIASISAAVTTTAAAQITGQAALNAANIAPPIQKRSVNTSGLQKRGLLDSLLGAVGLKLHSSVAPAPVASPAPIAALAGTASVSSTSLSCSAIGSGSLFSTSNNKYTVRCGTDVPGLGDLYSGAGTSFSDCIKKCDNVNGCCAVTYSANAATCFFKNLRYVSTPPSPCSAGTGDFAFMPSAYSAGLTGLSANAVSSALSALLPAGSSAALAGLPASALSAALGGLQPTAYSSALTALPASAASAAVGAIQSTISSVSCTALNALSYITANNKYQLRCGYDVPSVGDIGNTIVNNFSDCLGKCDAFGGCCAVSYASALKTCYFKNLKGSSSVPAPASGMDFAFLPSLFPNGVSGAVATASNVVTAPGITISSSTLASVPVINKGVSTTNSAVASSTVSAVTPVLQTGGGLDAPNAAPTAAATTAASSTVNSVTGSSTSSAPSACATTPEDGTYCGFINPEDPCAPQPDGYGPNITNPDTPANWMAQSQFQSMAANAPTPFGWARTFSNMNGSVSASSYMGLWTLKSYDPSACAAICTNNTGCTSFNIFIERDPSLNPCKNDSTAYTPWGYWCPQPSSITNYKCTLWGSNIDASVATNQGGWREDFNVVITGSNGYDKTNTTVPTNIAVYNPPQNCSNSGINGGSYWMGSKFYPGPFDPTLCAAYANATNSVNEQAAIAAQQTTFTPCQMFNAYHVYKNNIPMGTYCSLYDAALSTKWATVQGSWSGNNYYGVRNSWQYQRTVPHSGKCGAGS